MSKKDRKHDKQERVFGAEIREVNAEKRSLSLSFSSETPCQGWWGREVLSHSEEDVSLQRLEDVGSVLFNHGRDPNYGKMPIAKIEKAWIDQEEGKGRAEIQFDDDADSMKIFDKVQKGMLKGVSVGYVVHQWEEVAPGNKSIDKRFEGPMSVARNWEPIEISIVATPADPVVGIGRDADLAEALAEALLERQNQGKTKEESGDPDVAIVADEESEAKVEARRYLWSLRKKINT